MPVIFLDPRELVWLIFYGRTGGKKMRQKVIWTDAADDRLRELRFAGLTWDQVAKELELGRNTVLERGRRIRARRPVVRAEHVVSAGDRPALPPGHPIMWSLLTDGTVLAGQPYPYPVFL
jgi:hypothetical protein